MHTQPFEQFAAYCALAAAVAGFGYSTAFCIYLNDSSRGSAYASSLLLLTGALLSTAVFTGLYGRLRETDASFALWAFVLALAGALGAALHGAYDLANLANPPEADTTGLPSASDPRGFGTFALSGLALAVTGWLILRGGRLPRALGYMAFLAAALLVYVYVGRLTILDPKSPAILPFAVISGFLVNPLWYAWLGVSLLRLPRTEAVAFAG
jgi:hypothetical protein